MSDRSLATIERGAPAPCADAGAPEVDWKTLLAGPRPSSLAMVRFPDQAPVICACLEAADRIRFLMTQAGQNQAQAITLTVPKGMGRSTWERKYLAYKREGWSAFLDKRDDSKLWKGRNRGVDKAVVDTFSRLVLDNQRPMSGREAYLALKERGALPRGCSYANLMRLGPTARERAQAKQGALAAREHRAPARFTRANGWVMGRVSMDDVWLDQLVLYPLLGQRPQIVRPVGGVAGDYYTGMLFAHFLRPRVRRADGTTENLTEWEFLCFVEYICRSIGVSRRGTEFLVENQTATIRRRAAEALKRATDGLVSVAYSGISKKRGHLAQWGAKGGGNPRAKGWLESLWNLLHNRCGRLPGQMGLSPEKAPEDLGHLLRYTEGLIDAAIREQGGRAEGEIIPALRMPLLWWGDYSQRVNDIIGDINRRQDHELEGWDDHHIVDPATGILRRRSPAEVWSLSVSEGLQRIDDAGSADILGHENAKPRTIGKGGEISIAVRALSSNDLLFDGSALGLRQGDKVKALVNEFAPDRLFVFDLGGEFLGAAPAIRRADAFQAAERIEEIQRVETIEAHARKRVQELKAPAAQAKRSLVAHNDKVLADARQARGLPPAAAAGSGAAAKPRKKLLALSGVGTAGAATSPESATAGAATPAVSPPKRFRLGAF